MPAAWCRCAGNAMGAMSPIAAVAPTSSGLLTLKRNSTARLPSAISAVSQSPIERFLDAVDRLDVDAAMALMAPDARVLAADGRRAEGTEAVRQLFGDFLGQLRSTTHWITAQWHQEDVWIAEVDASYELRDWLQLNGLPRAFVMRASPVGVSELRADGAHEHRLS